MNPRKGILFNVLSISVMAFAPVINKFAISGGHISVTQAAFLNIAYSLLLGFLFARIRKKNATSSATKRYSSSASPTRRA